MGPIDAVYDVACTLYDDRWHATVLEPATEHRADDLLPPMTCCTPTSTGSTMLRTQPPICSLRAAVSAPVDFGC